MKSKEIRESFLAFFESKGHTRVKSSSLIPAEDPTLLFTNAGMNQFKDCFLGTIDPGYRRATSSQKCVRAGGKHNDLENVGFTPRHHTFFEMLGNFSFGDYFKEDAIAFAWEYLTEVLKLPKERLWVTVFETDDEAFTLWEKQGVPTERIHRLGEKDNFWAMGDTGPCGPCTEIHWDWGEEFGPMGKDGKPDWENGRFLEVWNLVFMQFNRDSSGKMEPLPKPSVDTGSGLERLTAVMQNHFSNYDTDLFRPLIEAVSKETGVAVGKSEATDNSMRVIADHLRSGSFLLSDGVLPSNEGRGYVLRRILRRAIRHGKNLGQERPFLFRLVDPLIQVMGEAYPDLKSNVESVKTLLKEEEQRFHETLHRGMGILEQALAEGEKQGRKVLPGEVAFKLYDSFGFPLDLTEVICRERGIDVDTQGFDTHMEKQRAQSSWSGGASSSVQENLGKALTQVDWETTFDRTSLSLKAKVVGLYDAEGNPTESLTSGQTGFLCTDSTPFYAESGGQAGDHGGFYLPAQNSLETALEKYAGRDPYQGKIVDTFKHSNRIVHRIEMLDGEARLDAVVVLMVDEDRRRKTRINHTATHMLHAALREVLGDRVKQAGSLVQANRLRFDFTYPKSLTAEQKKAIEDRVNRSIRENQPVQTDEMSYDEAIEAGALAFFDEKYGDQVRVVRIGEPGSPFSVELCGGTHLEATTSEVGFFKILAESSVASGVRRIEAITADQSLEYLDERNRILEQVEKTVGVKAADLVPKVESLSRQIKELEKQNESLKVKLARGGGGGEGGSLWDKKEEISGLQIVMDEVAEGNPKILRTLVDQVRDKLQERTMVLLASRSEGKATLCLGLTKDLTKDHSARDIIGPLAEKVGGRGGGRPDFAQAGGTDPSQIPQAFEQFRTWLKDLP